MRSLAAVLLFCGACATQKSTTTTTTTTTQTTTTTTSTQPADPPPVQTEMIQVTADDLMHDYTLSAGDADLKYKGKIVQVQSTINGIGHDAGGNHYLFLAAGDAGRAIQAYLAPGAEAGLQKGQLVTVKGRVEGRVAVNVVLRGATVGN